MKRRFIKLVSVMAISALLFTACQEEGIAPDENSITAAIEKIETSYVEGDIKELTYDGVKIETRASARFIKKRIEQQIEEQRSSMKHTNSRLGQTDYDVGVIPKTDWCPYWSEKITIHMDCEDHRPSTKWGWNGNWKGSWEITSDKDVRMRFCRVDGRLLHSIRKDNYGVLKLGSLQPPGTRLMTRTFDNEDTRNNNWKVGNISPNTQNAYSTTLHFLIFNKSSSASTYNSFHDFSFGYGVFAKETTHIGTFSGYHYTNKILIDDEDTHNANSMNLVEWWIPSDIGLFSPYSANSVVTYHRVM